MTKITKFPQALDTENELPDIDLSRRMNEAGYEHDVQHTLLNQAVVEIQKKVGADNSTDNRSLDNRVRYLEEHGSGGSGLRPLDDQDPMFIELNETQIIPDHPSLWCQVIIEGEKYAIPAFKVIPPIFAPANFESQANASLNYPKKFSGKTEWEGEFDGNDIN